jgi:hypothetical protein
MALDMTSFDAALKQHYTSDQVQNMVYKDNPLLALLPKYEDFGGKNLPIPLIYGNPQGRSASFSNAQSRGATTSSLITDFVLTRVKDYSIATIDNETLEASKGNPNAFMEAATTEIDGAIQSLTRSLAVSLYRDSSGAIGQVKVEPSENVGSFVVELKLASDVTNFEVGQKLVIWSAKSGGSQRISSTGVSSFVISAVDRSDSKLTLDVTYDSNGTIAADDYLFVEGDRGLKLSGLESWVPATAPTSALFFGVDRSVDTTRLGGIRFDGSALPIEEAMIEGASRGAREGGKIDHCFISYKKYAELEKALGSKVQYVDLTMNAEVGFRGIVINGPRGPIKVIADQNCPDDVAWMLDIRTWKLYSLGKAVRVIDSDGLSMLRQASADGVECRFGFYGNLGSRAPGYNVRVKLA